ncbi:MAG: TIGR02147 family protein [Deltaproteobacteria bacterium]|nr:TIGR02147 family protein [Deltaproteobacteria bacterium]
MARGPTTPVNLFSYLDYRAFLRDWYAAMKRTQRAFSFRAFALRAGFTSPNFLKLVMDGARNLTEKSLPKFMIGLRLNKQEQEFFRNLVGFNQAADTAERDRYYQRLLSSRKYNELRPIERQQYEYYAAWYHPVIRELVTAPDFDGTPTWIANRLNPAITPAQVEKSLGLLEQLGFLQRTSEGRWAQTSTLVSTGAEVRSVMLLNYHRNLLDLTKTILDITPASERDVSALTLGIAKERLPMLKRKVQEFRQEILKLVANDTAPELVVQLNLQLFPVSRAAAEDAS